VSTGKVTDVSSDCCAFTLRVILLNCLTLKMKKQRSFKTTTSDQSKGKGKADPLWAWSGPAGSRKLRFPDFMTTTQDGGKVVSPMHRPPLPPGNAPGTHFC